MNDGMDIEEAFDSASAIEVEAVGFERKNI
jgi:hypothetical protein